MTSPLRSWARLETTTKWLTIENWRTFVVNFNDTHCSCTVNVLQRVAAVVPSWFLCNPACPWRCAAGLGATLVAPSSVESSKTQTQCDVKVTTEARKVAPVCQIEERWNKRTPLDAAPVCWRSPSHTCRLIPPVFLTLLPDLCRGWLSFIVRHKSAFGSSVGNETVQLIGRLCNKADKLFAVGTPSAAVMKLAQYLAFWRHTFFNGAGHPVHSPPLEWLHRLTTKSRDSGLAFLPVGSLNDSL